MKTQVAMKNIGIDRLELYVKKCNASIASLHVQVSQENTSFTLVYVTVD